MIKISAQKIPTKVKFILTKVFHLSSDEECAQLISNLEMCKKKYSQHIDITIEKQEMADVTRIKVHFDLKRQKVE